MPVAARGDAIEILLDAVRTRLSQDAPLAGLVTGVYGHVPGASRVAYPYIRIGSPTLDEADYGGMGTAGGRLSFELDCWSNAKGAHTVRQILARVKVVLLRAIFDALAGHTLAAGSLVPVDDRDFDEPDPDMPEELLYHGHQTWEALIEET